MRSIDILTHVPEKDLAAARAVAPGARFHLVPTEGEPPADVRGEVLLTIGWGSPNMKALLERGVRWVHTIGTGVDRFPLGEVGDRILTCSRGASGDAISEWVLAVMLAFEKDLPHSWIRQPPESWNAAELGSLKGKTLGLLGLGGIGIGVARKALAFGMHVVAYRRSERPSPLPEVRLLRDLDELVARADHLVIAASSTSATRHILGAELLARAKPGLHVVNIARGALIDQDALRVALDDGRVARASLDVCDPEPLPAGHWLYDHAKVRLSPHISWSAPYAMEQLFATFAENLRRYLAGEPLEGLVDLEQGY